MKLKYIIKYVGDMEKAVEFYQNQLGLGLSFQSSHWSEFELGETKLALHLASDEHPVGSIQLGFGVPDVDAAYSQLQAKGVEFSLSPTDLHGSRMAKFLDSDSAEFSLGET